MKKLTKVNKFKKSVIKYQDYFALFQWEIHVFEKTMENRAEVIWNDTGGIVSVYYSKKWIEDKDVDLNEVDKVAFHEMAELFLQEQYDLIGRSNGWDKAQKQTHNIIRFLENKVYPTI